MAIRFQCGSCNQPIEVDDPWGGRTVACPYCHSTVTAPSASTLDDLDDIPTASPVVAAGIDAGDPVSVQPGESSNVVALVAIILAMVVIALIGLGTMIAAPHALEMEQIARELEKAEDSAGSATKAIIQYAQSRGGDLPTWMFMLGMIQMVTLATSVAAIVCGIIGLRHARRRRMAVAALAICGGVTIYFCAGMAFSFA